MIRFLLLRESCDQGFVCIFGGFLGYDEGSVCKLCCTESVGNLWWPATWANSE